MAEDLDRGYVINGHDLLIALRGMNGRWPAVPNPRAMAGDILDVIGEPLDGHRALLSQKQLTERLRGFNLTVEGKHQVVNGEVDDPETVAKVIFAEHSAGLAHREPEEAALREPDAADAHVHACCDHGVASRAAYELGQADRIVEMLGPPGYDGGRRVKRVLRWAWDYLTDGDEPPF